MRAFVTSTFAKWNVIHKVYNEALDSKMSQNESFYRRQPTLIAERHVRVQKMNARLNFARCFHI